MEPSIFHVTCGILDNLWKRLEIFANQWWQAMQRKPRLGREDETAVHPAAVADQIVHVHHFPLAQDNSRIRI